MTLLDKKITIPITLDALAYILTTTHDRDTFLEFVGYIAGIEADSSFERDLIEYLFDRLIERDATAARDLIECLMSPWEELEI